MKCSCLKKQFHIFQFYNVFWSLFDLVWITSFCYIWTQNLPKYNLRTWTWSTPCISTFIGSWSVWPRGTVYIRIVSSYALSFYRSQNVLCWSKFFVSDQKFIYILCQSQTFCARPKDDLHSVKLVFVLAQKFLKRH